MKIIRQLFAICAVVAGFASLAPLAHAQDAMPKAQASVPNGLVLRGDARCTECHDESDKGGAALRIGKSKHGTIADGRTPTCSDCHGESNAHVGYKGSGKPPKPDFAFGKMSRTDAQDRNKACMSCHDTDVQRRHWQGSAHQSRDVACTSCHQIHTGHDAVRDKREQAEVCYTCHKEQRALANKPSHHPIPEGKMSCSDCHNPHGTTADFMLKTRAPFLCLSCHDPSSHLGYVPGVAANVNTSKNPSGTIISATTPPDNWNTNTAVGTTQGLSCMNCHTQVHGSNNPVNSTNAMHFWR